MFFHLTAGYKHDGHRAPGSFAKFRAGNTLCWEQQQAVDAQGFQSAHFAGKVKLFPGSLGH